VRTSAYKPGVRQTIQIIVEHPETMRWGVQLTARLPSDESSKAGTFVPNATVQVRCGENAPQATAAPTPNARIRGVWELEWTPPDTDVGEVVFYAPGNAANGNNNDGDYIYTTRVAIPAEVCNFTETPRVTTVRHGASFLARRPPCAQYPDQHRRHGIPGAGRNPAGVSHFARLPCGGGHGAQGASSP